MNAVKTLILVIVICLLFPAWIAIQSLVSVGATFLNSDFYLSRFEAYDAYEFTPEFMAQIIEDYSGEFPQGTSEFIIKAIDSKELQSWVETEIASVIDGSRNFLFGLKPQPNLTINFTPIKSSISENISRNVPQEMKVSLDSYLQKIPDQLNLVQDTAGDNAERAIIQYRRFRLFPPIMLIVFITAIFLLAGFRNGAIWLGSSILAAGAITAIGLSITLLAADSHDLLRPELRQSFMSPEGYMNLESMMADSISTFIRVFRNVSGIFALFGVSLITAGAVMKGFHRRDTSIERRIDSMQ